MTRPFLRLLLALLAFCGVAGAQQSVRQADASCEGCHRDIYRKYLASPMANASGLAGDHFLPGDFTHTPSGVHYSVSRQAGTPTLTFNDTRDPRITGTHPLQFFLGSGHLGTTYLYTQGGYLMESPVAWYASTHSYDMKPGFGDVTEMPPAVPMEPGCLRCHMSGVAPAEPGTRNRYAGLPFAQTGITCESCHGDTSAHVASQGKAPVVNPAKLSADRRDAVCMSCHLEGNVAVTRAHRDSLAYHPGDRLSDLLSFFVLADRDPLERGVSEVEQLSMSHCKRASGDRMSCSSCHDPHGSPSPQERVAFFRGKCLQCHSAPGFTTTHHPENPDCTGCHMPQNGAANTPHVAWTDHRILRNPAAVLPSAPSVAHAGLTPIFSPGADARDLALARYSALMGGELEGRDLDTPAATLAALKASNAAGAQDSALLEALGNLGALTGDRDTSRTAFLALLKADPHNLSALSNLAVLAARAGHPETAIQLATSAFSRNQYDLNLARNLALLHCAAGDSAAAKQVLVQALSFSPGDRETWNFACPVGSPSPAK